jgi:hypothetical protein
MNLTTTVLFLAWFWYVEDYAVSTIGTMALNYAVHGGSVGITPLYGVLIGFATILALAGAYALTAFSVGAYRVTRFLVELAIHK